MSKNQENTSYRSGVVTAMPILAELYRVQLRAQARLGDGIHPRSVVKMVSKIEVEKKTR
ncbi:MAG: hypothetical protein JXA42_25820 [Anaerolineales bacterium]|nr:hypothetical protein [Anaerolineales bacterium]